MTIIRAIAIVIFFVWLNCDSILMFRYKTSKAENKDRFSLILLMVSNTLAMSGGIWLAFTHMGAMGSVTLQIIGLAVHWRGSREIGLHASRHGCLRKFGRLLHDVPLMGKHD